MREIKFRGKSIVDSKWFYGSLVYFCEKYSISESGEAESFILPVIAEVIPETVGQFTGLKDKKGKKIYEGDVAKLKHCTALYTCTWVPDTACFYWLSNVSNDYSTMHHESEIIGNIYENPELINKEVNK